MLEKQKILWFFFRKSFDKNKRTVSLLKYKIVAMSLSTGNPVFSVLNQTTKVYQVVRPKT